MIHLIYLMKYIWQVSDLITLRIIAWTKVEQIMSTLDTVSIQFNFREIQYSTNIEIGFHDDRLITLIIVQSI